MTAAAEEQRSTSSEADGRGAWAGVLRSGGVRLLVLPVSAVLGIVVTRLIIENYGPAAFAQYGLLVGIGALLPFTDLGMSAAVVNAVAGSADVGTDDRVRRVIVTAVRVLCCSAAVLALVGLALGAMGLWPTLLGSGLLPGSGSWAATACIVLIALAMPLGVGQRVLAGLRLNHISVAVMGLQTPVVLCVLLVLLHADVAAGGALAAIPYAVTLALAAACSFIAVRKVRPTLGLALRQVPHVRTVRGAKVFDVAWPTLIQLIALPLAMQTDRLVLSHAGDSGALAEYNLAWQMFTPIWLVVNTAGFTLWAVFARERARGARTSPMPMVAGFAGISAALALAVALASPFLAQLASGGAITLSTGVVVSFAVFMVFQGAKYPLGMYLTDAAGLRFQALMVVLMLPVNLALSWWLVTWVGAAGPVIGSIVGVGLFQFLAGVLEVRRRLRGAPAEAAASAA